MADVPPQNPLVLRKYGPLQKQSLDELKRKRAELIEEIRGSQKTIEHSRELIKRIDRMLAKAAQRKP
jgi:hypothetical protein